jgi:hypothetical protein
LGLVCGVGCVESSAGFVGGLELFFWFDFKSDLFGSWRDFGWILGARNGPQIDVSYVFFDVFFEVDLGIDF